MGQDSATITVTIFERATSRTLATRIISFSKSRAGIAVGTPAVVELNASDFSLTYDSAGQTPNPSSISLTATARNFTSPRFKFTGAGITDDTSFGTSSTKAFNVASSIVSSPQTVLVEVVESS